MKKLDQKHKILILNDNVQMNLIKIKMISKSMIKNKIKFNKIFNKKYF